MGRENISLVDGLGYMTGQAAGEYAGRLVGGTLGDLSAEDAHLMASAAVSNPYAAGDLFGVDPDAMPAFDKSALRDLLLSERDAQVAVDMMADAYNSTADARDEAVRRRHSSIMRYAGASPEDAERIDADRAAGDDSPYLSLCERFFFG